MVRNFGLDCIRALSIWLVLLQHGGINITGMTPLKIGGIGVEFFFVLSGFLIGGILFKEIEKGNTFYETLKSFWIRRWFRILPLYYGVLLFKFIFINNSIGLNIIYYLLFLQNNFYGIEYLNVSWSLVIEEWFYLFAPIFLIIVYRLSKKPKWILFAMISFILFVVGARFVFVYAFDRPYAAINGNFPFRFDALFIGVLLAFLNRYFYTAFDRLKTLPFFILGIIIFLGYLYTYWRLAYPINTIDNSLFIRSFGFFILPLSIAMMIPFVSNIGISRNSNILNQAVFQFVTYTSILTYAIYLIHPFIYSFEWNLGLAIVVTYAISWVVYTYFEKPILKYRDRIKPG